MPELGATVRGYPRVPANANGLGFRVSSNLEITNNDFPKLERLIGGRHLRRLLGLPFGPTLETQIQTVGVYFWL